MPPPQLLNDSPINVDVGQSFKTFGYGCTSCRSCVGTGDAEVDIIYISFIVSVQHLYIIYRERATHRVLVDN